ncbi:MAG: hypothetical protein Kow0089_14000 [Desulfobulbaceae bacterium]
MFSARRKPAPQLDFAVREKALACVVVKNPQVRERETGNRGLLLTYQVRVKAWFQAIVRRITGREDDLIERKLELDELGTAVWRMIDGRKEVAELIDEFRREYRLDHREAELSVTAFLRELGRRGLIALHEKE